MTGPVWGLLVIAALVGGLIGFVFANGRLDRRRAALEARTVDPEEPRHQALFAAAPEGIITFDEQGVILDANPAAHELFGCGDASLIGLSGADVIDPADHAHALAAIRDPANVEAGRLNIEFRGRRRNGDSFPLQAAMTYSPPGEDWYGMVFVRDISRQRDIEKIKDEFVSTVSHELRTPLTSIAGSLGLIAGGAVGTLPPKASRLISIAQSNSQRLVRLINDVLDMEKLASGNLPFNMTDTVLGDVVTRSVEMTRGYADQMKVRFEIEDGASGMRVRGDPDRLIQVVTNLLSNAAKYSPAGETVTVRLVSDGPNARVSVTDRGPGVPEAFRDRIFTRFAQADASDARGKSGTGLGLYIARGIVERHGGRLWFDSTEGGGATFHFELPALSDQPTGPSATDRILLVEDEPAAAAILSAILEDDGLRVDVASTLAEARYFLERHGRYGAAVLDLRLPDGDGVDLIKEIRAKPHLGGMPIVVVSADARRGIDPEVRMLEVADWMEKPVDPDRLTDLVRRAVDKVGEKRRLILHVDDDRDIREVVATALSAWGEVASVDGLAEARDVLARMEPDLLILDLELRDGHGADLIDELALTGGGPPIIVFSAQDAEDEPGGNVRVVLVKSKTPLSGLESAVAEVFQDVP